MITSLSSWFRTSVGEYLSWSEGLSFSYKLKIFQSALGSNDLLYWRIRFIVSVNKMFIIHWGKADDRNCIYGHPKMSDEKLG